MGDEAEERYLRPIVNASFPGTLAALSLTVFGIIDIRGTPPLPIRIALLFGATAFVLSAFCIFFYGMYPTRKRLWTATALLYLLGLCSSLISVILLLIWPPSTTSAL